MSAELPEPEMRRFAKLAFRIIQSNLSELHYPYRLLYSVTDRCQSRCIMCNIWQKPPADELSTAEIEKFFARNNRFSWINLTGGEIFLRNDIVDIFHSIARHCSSLYLLNFATNGLLTKDIVSGIREILERTCIPKLMVTVSLDGPPEMHDHIRGVPGSWNRAVETFQQLKNMRSNRFSVYFGYTLQEANLHLFQQTVSAVKHKMEESSYDDFHVNIAQVSGHYYGNTDFQGTAVPLESVRLLAKFSAARTKKVFDPVMALERTYQRLAEVYLTSGKTPLPCQAAAASFFLDASGTVYPCTGFSAPIGSLRDNDFDLQRIWNSPERRKVRKDVCEGACPHCWTPCEAYQTILARLPELLKTKP